MVEKDNCNLRGKTAAFLRYIIAALLFSIVFEALSLFFTDNQMYGPDGSVVAMRIVNWFRMAVWFGLSLLILFCRKNIWNFFIGSSKYVSKKDICDMVFLEAGILFGGFVILKLIGTMILRYHLILLVCFGLFIIVEYYYFRGKIQNAETMFLLTAMLVSVCYIFTAPVFVMGGDQGIHFRRTVELAQSYQEAEFESEQESYNEEGTNVLIEKMDHAIIEADKDPIYSYTESKPLKLSSLRYIAYIPPAAALAVADAINMPPAAAYFAGQLCNAFVYIFLIYQGARKLKAGKLTLIMFASLPRMLFLATRYSYTPWVVAWMTFAGACIIGETQRPDKMVGWKDMLVIAGSFLAGMLVKAPYFLMIPIALLITGQKFKNLNLYRKYMVLMGGTMLVLLMTLIIPIFVNERGFDIYSDVRGGTNVNAFGQMKFIVMHPVKYAGILLRNIYRLFSFSAFVVGKDGFTGIRAGMPGVLPTIVLLLFVWVIITDKKVNSESGLRGKERVLVFGLTFVNICWICTVMYMNYSEVGAAVLSGCNPMYLMAFMFPFFYYCRSRHVQSNFNWRMYNTVIYGMFMIIMFANIYVRIINMYV